MTIIIDGYNVLKQREPREYISEEQRLKLIKLAEIYGLRKEHSMVIAFDGGPMPKPSREVHDDVTVLYAGWQLTADDIIKEYIEEHVAKELLLVSSDSQLCRFASHHGVTAIDSLAFWEIMEDTLKKEYKKGVTTHEKAVKTTGREDQLIDDLMQEATATIVDKDRGATRAKMRLREAKRGSKAERLLKKKLAKL